MPPTTPGSSWCSLIRFHEEPTPDLIVACSDGRFAPSFEDFMTNGLGVERFARLIVPGGPVFLAAEAPPFHDGAGGAFAQLFFIIDALRIERVHLVQHARCAFYLQAVGVAPDALRDRQVADLDRAAERLAELRPRVESQGWVADVEDETVVFSPV